MTKIVGLTGGIGSGKTTVAKMFEKLGIQIYIADDEAKKITNKPSTLKVLEKNFGKEVIKDNELNRPLMAQIVFNDPKKLTQLNAIIHPLVAKDFANWLQQNKSEKFVIKEAAILLETATHHNCDFIITVTAPIEVRIKRIIERDHICKDEILNRMKNQWTDEQRIAKSNFIIENVSLAQTQKQVLQIFNNILNT